MPLVLKDGRWISYAEYYLSDTSCNEIVGDLRPMDAATRKKHPIATGVLDYFPDALMAVANVSFIGSEQHHPGEPIQWDRSLSADEPDALMRHLKDRGKLDTDGIRHSAKVAWRALALLQKEIENEH